MIDIPDKPDEELPKDLLREINDIEARNLAAFDEKYTCNLADKYVMTEEERDEQWADENTPEQSLNVRTGQDMKKLNDIRKEKGHLSISKVRMALAITCGDIPKAAEELGIRLNKLNRFIAKRPNIQSMLMNHRKDLVALAESNLRTLLMAGDKTATIFVLRTLGKELGYADNIHITPVVKNDITAMNDADLMRLVEEKSKLIELKYKKSEGQYVPE
jgi:hypothetical protein